MTTGDPLGEEALDLHCYSGSEDEEEDGPADEALKTAGFPAAESKEGSKDGERIGRQVRSVVVKPATHRVYKEALIGSEPFGRDSMRLLRIKEGGVWS